MASILAMVGCAKNSDFDNTTSRNRVEMTVLAAEQAPETSRVAFSGAITNMVWEANDQIGVHVASTGETATFVVKELSQDGKQATFRAIIDEPAAIDSYYAFYPSTSTVSGSEAIFNLPAETTGAGAPLLVASNQEVVMNQVALNFKPVTAILELTLGFAADKVVIEGNNGEALSGECKFNFADGSVSYPTGAASLTLTSPLQGANYLYLPAVELSKGYKVTVWVGEQQMVQSVAYATGKSFKAGEVSTLAINEFKPVTVNLCDVVTSYTLYTRGDSSANSTDAYTIAFNGSCSFSGISTTLVEECGVYCGSTKVVGTRSGKEFTVTAATGVAKGAHSVCAYVKAGGVEYKSAATTAYITGLPFSQELEGANPTGWSCSNTLDQNGFMMRSGEAYAISPAFYIPTNTNINATFSMHAYRPKRSYSPKVYISASESDSTANLAHSGLSSDIALPGAGASFNDVSAVVTMTPSVQKICLHTSGTGPSNTFLVTKHSGVHTKSCTITYAF